MFDLTEKRALVTGASGGIGSAIARSLHAQGAFVVLSGTRDRALDSLASELGLNAYVVPADLSSPEGAKNLANAAAAAMPAALRSILVDGVEPTAVDAAALRLALQQAQCYDAPVGHIVQQPAVLPAAACAAQTIGASFAMKKVEVNGRACNLGIWVRNAPRGRVP